MCVILTVGVFVLWQWAMLWAVGRLVRGHRLRAPRFPRTARVPREFASGEWDRV